MFRGGDGHELSPPRGAGWFGNRSISVQIC